MITVFYDGKCSLCAREIKHYRKIAPTDIFDWQDITECSDFLKKEGISLSTGLRLLHAKDEANKMHIGADAFILIWKQLRWWNILAIFVGLPIIRQIANMIYRLFASWRFKRLDHCQLAAKEESST